MSIVEDVLSVTDSILSIRDEIGAVKSPVFILTRTWAGGEVGKGLPTDSLAQILPSPHIVDFGHDLRVKEGGAVKQGDLILKSISKQSYPLESDVDCSTDGEGIEKFYFINNRIYEVVHAKSRYVTWQVHVRKTIKQKTYLPKEEDENELP